MPFSKEYSKKSSDMRHMICWSLSQISLRSYRYQHPMYVVPKWIYVLFAHTVATPLACTLKWLGSLNPKIYLADWLIFGNSLSLCQPQIMGTWLDSYLPIFVQFVWFWKYEILGDQSYLKKKNFGCRLDPYNVGYSGGSRGDWRGSLNPPPCPPPPPPVF